MFRARGNFRVRDDVENVLQMPVPLSIAADHTKLRGRDPAPLGLFHFERRARAQLFERLHKLLAVGAGIDQRANRHVSADAGERIQVADFHAINWGKSSPEGPCRNSSIESENPVSAMLISTTRAPDDFAMVAKPAAG